MKIKQKTAAKIGLFSAVMIIFGAVVGIGIFFKNVSVFKANNNNWLGVLLSWVLAIVMAMCMALSFGELVTCKLKNKSDGLGGWASAYCGNSFGRYTRLSHSLIYYPVIIFAVAIFAGEALLNCITPGTVDYGNLTTLYVFLIGGVLFGLFIVLNYVASKAMNKFSDIAGIVKFVPIVAVVILGIVFGILNSHGGLWNGHVWSDGQLKTTGSLSVTGIIGSIPAILFAFEGYTIIGNVAGDMEKPEKNVPLAIVIAMIIISVVNLAITIGCMTAGVGSVYDLMNVVFSGKEQLIKIFNIVMSIFIFICILGVLNAMVFSGMRALQAYASNGTLLKGKQLINKKPNNPVHAGAIYLSILFCFWFVALGIPSCILNTDQIADGSTNILIIFFYLLYAILLIGAFANRFNKKVEVVKLKVFPVTVVIGILCCIFMFAFSGIYENIVRVIQSPNATDCSWGLFVVAPAKLFNWEAATIFWSIFAFMALMPLIHDALVSKCDKANKTPLIWQKNNLSVLID